MKCFVIFAFFSLQGLTIFSQHLGLSIGYSNNHFFDFEENDFHNKANYNDGYGYAISFILDSLLLNRIRLKLALNFNKNSGSIFTRGGGLGAGSTTRADVNKYSIGLAIFPVHIKIMKTIKVNLGGEFNYLIKSNLNGTQSYWGPGSTLPVDLGEGRVNLLNKFTIGIISRIGCNIKLNNQWNLVPEYNFYFGLTNEFKDVVFNIKSFRHCLMVGITNRFN